MIAWIKKIFKRKPTAVADSTSAPCYAIVEHDSTLEGDGVTSSTLGVANPLEVVDTSGVIAHFGTDGIGILNGDKQGVVGDTGIAVTDTWGGTTRIASLGAGEVGITDGTSLKKLCLTPSLASNTPFIVLTWGDFNTTHFNINNNKVGLVNPFDPDNYYDKAGVDHELLFFYTKSDINSGWLVKSITGTNGVNASTSNGVATLSANLSAGTGISLGTGNPVSISINESTFKVRDVAAGNGVTLSGTTTRTINAPLTAGNGITLSGGGAGVAYTVTAGHTAGNGISITQSAGASTTIAVSDTVYTVKSITAGNGISASTASGVTTIATNLSAGNGVTISSAAARVIAAPHTAGNGITITQSAGASTTIATNFTAGPGISISAAANRVFKSELGSDDYSGITITQGANGAAHKVAVNLEAGTGIRIDNGSSGTAKKITSTVSGMTEVYHDSTLKGTGTSQTSSNALGLSFVNTFQDITTTDKAQIFEAGEYDYATLTDCYGTRNAQNAYIIARWESFIPVATQNKVGLQIKHKSKWLPTEYLGPISSSENSSWCCPFTYYVKDSSTYYYEAWLAGIGRWSTSNGKFYILAYDQPYIGLIFEQLTPPVRIEIHMRYIVTASYRDV